MSFAKIRPTWAFNSVPTSTEFNQLDLNQSRAIDGFAGGTYAPSGAIVIGGQGISLSAGNSVTGSLVFGSGAILQGAGAVLNWAADAHFGYFGVGATTFANGASVSAGTFAFLTGTVLQVQSGATLSSSGTGSFLTGSATTFAAGSTLALNGTMTCTGATTFTGGPHILGTCRVGSGGQLQVDSGGTLSCNLGSTFAALGTFQIGAFATASCAAPLAMTGVGHLRQRAITGADADSTYGINDADVIYATVTAVRTYTLSNTGAADGDRIRIFANGNAINVQDAGGTPILTLAASKGADFDRIAGAWRTTMRISLPPSADPIRRGAAVHVRHAARLAAAAIKARRDTRAPASARRRAPGPRRPSLARALASRATPADAVGEGVARVLARLDALLPVETETRLGHTRRAPRGAARRRAYGGRGGGGRAAGGGEERKGEGEGQKRAHGEDRADEQGRAQGRRKFSACSRAGRTCRPA